MSKYQDQEHLFRFFIGIEGQYNGDGRVAFNASDYFKLADSLATGTLRIEGRKILLHIDVEDSPFRRKGYHNDEEFYHAIHRQE